MVQLRRSPKTSAADFHRPQASSGNGASTNGATHRPPPPLALGTGPDVTVASSAAGSVARALLAEMRALRDDIDEAHSTWVAQGAGDGVEEVTAQLLAEFQTLPKRIAAAMGAALEDQHRTIMADVRAALQSAVNEMHAGQATNGASRPWAAARDAPPSPRF